MTTADSPRAKFADTLAASGAVSDPEWSTAFRDIPRDPFVPYYFTQTPERSGWVLVESPSYQWAEGVYSNHRTGRPRPASVGTPGLLTGMGVGMAGRAGIGPIRFG